MHQVDTSTAYNEVRCLHSIAVLFPLHLQLCWQPLGVPLGMSMRALQHEWVMFHNIKAPPKKTTHVFQLQHCCCGALQRTMSCCDRRHVCGCCACQAFCQKHPDLHGCFLHAHAAIFVSSTPRLAPSAGTAVGASADAGTGSASPAGLSSSASNDSSNNVAAHNSGGDTQHRTIAAIILDKANGKTVKQRVKQKTWADASIWRSCCCSYRVLLRRLRLSWGLCMTTCAWTTYWSSGSSSSSQLARRACRTCGRARQCCPAAA
ncbi:hypothetical protein COO60DRAFT_1699529, partial [Scenedesmus sp. NREL 46B-D3]